MTPCLPLMLQSKAWRWYHRSGAQPGATPSLRRIGGWQEPGLGLLVVAAARSPTPTGRRRLAVTSSRPWLGQCRLNQVGPRKLILCLPHRRAGKHCLPARLRLSSILWRTGLIPVQAVGQLSRCLQCHVSITLSRVSLVLVTAISLGL